MQNEEDFYKELNTIPAMPDTLYPKIERKIKQQELLRRSIWLLAACIVLAVSGFNYYQFSVNQTKEHYAEAAEELQNIGEYFTAQDIEESFPIKTAYTEELTDNLSDITDYFNETLITQDIEMYSIVSTDIL